MSDLAKDKDIEEKKEKHGQEVIKDTNRCCVCKKKFGLGKKYQCKSCQEFVCLRHTVKKRESLESAKYWLCDNCDIELLREEIKEEIIHELEKLKENISLAKESYDKVEKSRIERCEIARKLEEELIFIERTQKKAEEEIQEKLNEELLRGKLLNESIDRSKKELEELYGAEKEISQKCLENEAKNEEIKDELAKMKEKKIELLAQVEHLSSRLKGSLPTEKVIVHLCEACKAKITIEERHVDIVKNGKENSSTALSDQH